MGKLNLIKGQPMYLAEKSTKRKKPHESDHDKNATGQSGKAKKPRKPMNLPEITPQSNNTSNPWQILNRQAFANPSSSIITFVPPPPSVIHVGMMAGPSKDPGASFSTSVLQPAKRAKVSASYTFASTGDNMCPLCGGPKHNLRDCLVPKGGVEK